LWSASNDSEIVQAMIHIVKALNQPSHYATKVHEKQLQRRVFTVPFTHKTYGWSSIN